MLKVLSVLAQFLHHSHQVEWHKIHSPLPMREALELQSNILHGSRRTYLPVTNKIFMALPVSTPAQEVENSGCQFQKMLFSINYRTTRKHVFQHYPLTRQTGVKINGKLKSYPPLLLGQLLKYLCHLTCYLKQQ